VKNGYIDFKVLNLRLVDLQHVATAIIEPQISEDSLKFNLDSNNRLLRQFTVYRLVTYIFSLLDTTNKVVFVLPDSLHLNLYCKNSVFLTNTFRKLASIISLTFIKDRSFHDCVRDINAVGGENKEIKNIISHLIQSNKKNISFNNLNKFLEKYKITKLQGELSNNFKVKLGLFVT